MDASDSALNALYGLWIGDAFGGHFEFDHVDWYRPKRAAMKRQLPPAVWGYTDDTQMALSVYDVLCRDGHIDADVLAHSFVQHFDIDRGYGAGAEKLLQAIATGGDWRTLSAAMFEGTRSYGNGAAMRVAPIGAYFSGDIQAVIENTRRSAIITHTHPDAIAGAIAVAVAASQMVLYSSAIDNDHHSLFWKIILSNTPDGKLHQQLTIAANLPNNTLTSDAAKMLGCGWQISAVDTVPFALWCAITYITDFEEALWQCISVGGDADTTGAIVGGLLGAYLTRQKLPQTWIERCEPLPLRIP